MAKTLINLFIINIDIYKEKDMSFNCSMSLYKIMGFAVAIHQQIRCIQNH